MWPIVFGAGALAGAIPSLVALSAQIRRAAQNRSGIDALNAYQRTGRPETLDMAVATFRDVVSSTPPDHPQLAIYLANLGNSLLRRFRRAGDRADVDEAVRAARQAVAVTPPGHSNRALYLSLLGESLLRRFVHAGDPEDLDGAVGAVRQAVALTPPGHADLAMRLSYFGDALLRRFLHTGDPEDLDGAVSAVRQAVALTPPGHADLAVYLSNLGMALRKRSEQASDSADLDEAVGAVRQAVALTSPGHTDLAANLANLGMALFTRFVQAGDPADLDGAIDAGRGAVASAPPGHPDRALCLLTLGESLLKRFQLTGDSADLDAAVDADGQAVALIPPGQPDLAVYLTNLGDALGSRFEWAGNPADLAAAIDAARRAAASAPPGYADLHTILSNLGMALLKRFERSGDPEDLDDAVDTVRQAVDLIPPGHAHLPSTLSNLGMALLRRFERAGDSADLDDAINAGRQAATLTPPGHYGLPMHLSTLAGALQSRFERAGDSADLDDAIDAIQQCVTLILPGDPNLASGLSNLGNYLLRRFERARDSADLDDAVDAGQRAVALTPADHPDLARRLSNLGLSLRTRFEHVGDSADLDAAVDAGQRATISARPGHPDLVSYLSNLGLSLRSRFERDGDPADLDGAISRWRQASQVPAGIPSSRLANARAWGIAAADAGRTSEAADAYTSAVRLMPTVAFHGLVRAAREEHLAQLAGLAADAAACAVLDGRAEAAVELLEQGRSVLWTQALNLRTDLAQLAGMAPDLAECLASIRAVLDTPLPEAVPLTPGPAGGTAPLAGRTRQQRDAADLRRRKAREWDETVARVRALQGFKHFLAAVPYADLAAVAVDGPVVIVNSSRYACHALIVQATSARPCIVNLPDLSLDDVVNNADKMLNALKHATDPRREFKDRDKDRRDILDILDWMWDVIAQPVLTALGYTSTPGANGPWPRLWWCPTGPLTILPIHAAGHHPRLRTATAGTECVLDRVISSYTPTLTALIRARQSSASARVRQLTVGMPTTPGLPPLVAATAELEVLADHFPLGADNHQLAGSQATCAAVLSAIATHSWIHLACHASQQHADPASSGLALWDSTLTITDLAGYPSRGRDLAFLSACETASGGRRHLDEAIHLAAAMQFLGYKNVIATMWTIADPPAPHVADCVYTTLTQNGLPEPGKTGKALHDAIRSLRDIDPTNPLLWAAYIHLGP